MTARSLAFLPLALAAAAASEGWRLGGSVGAGWYTAPSTYRQAEALRPAFVAVLDGWKELGPVSIGTELTNDFSHRTGKPSEGLQDREDVLLTSAVLLVGASHAVTEVPARLRGGFGAGVVHVWNRLERGSLVYTQSSWGPEFHLVGLWERDIGRHGLVLMRLAGVYAATLAARIEGTNRETSGDWSRVEFSMGWSWKG